MAKYTLRDFAEQIIRETNKPMTTSEIWAYGVEKGYAEKGGFKGKAAWNTIAQTLLIDIKENPQSKFDVDENVRPKRFYLKSMGKVEIPETPDAIDSNTGYTEGDLHKHLTYFAYTYMERVYTKTISHQISKRSLDKHLMWQHPDLVGVALPSDLWAIDLMDLSKEMGLLPLKLYSFELKKEVTSSNLRESFFQTVSNSSWAHEAYLVTAYLEQDTDFMQELKRLCNSFGIGVIKLDINNPDESEIVLSARTKEIPDWETINKLCKVNKDFQEFIKNVKINATIKSMQKSLYDSVLDVDELRFNEKSNPVNKNIKNKMTKK